MSFQGQSQTVSGSYNFSQYAWPLAVGVGSVGGYATYRLFNVIDNFGEAVSKGAKYTIEKAEDLVEYTQENVFTPLFLVFIAGAIVIVGGTVYLLK